MIDDICLIITGTISPPNGVYGLSIIDSDIRKKQYLDSIKYYIEKTRIKKIIYCDNSLAKEETELKLLAREYGKQFEWLTFVGDNAMVIEKGKGFGEGEIMKYVFENSEIVLKCQRFIKVTGRLVVKNIDNVVKSSRKEKFYCNIEGNKIYTNFYIMPIKMYMDSFYNAYKQVDDRSGFFLEHSFYQSAKKNCLKIKMFSCYPNIIGVSGSSGKDYYLPLKSRIKRSVKGKIYNFINY